MFLNKYKKNNYLFRCFTYSNIHEVSCNLEKLTILHTQKKNVSLKSLIKISTFLELITTQRSFFIRSKKSFASWKLRKGAPIGAKVTLRKSKLFLFLFKLVWHVLPSIKNFVYKKKNYNLKQKNLNSLQFTFSSVLIFPELQFFYFFFKSFKNLKISFSFSNSITKYELFFISRFYKIPS